MVKCNSVPYFSFKFPIPPNFFKDIKREIKKGSIVFDYCLANDPISNNFPIQWDTIKLTDEGPNIVVAGRDYLRKIRSDMAYVEVYF